jgi:hypothetical protein
MLDYRSSLAGIGISTNTPVNYREFSSKPSSLRQTIASMSAPASAEWAQVADVFRDEYWTDEVQGVAWDGSNWIFSTNANQKKPSCNDKAIYVFPGGSPLKDNTWSAMLAYKDILHPFAGLHESDDHWGQLTFYDGHVYVAHFWDDDGQSPRIGYANVVVFKTDRTSIEFIKWIELDRPTSPTDGKVARAEFQGINPWDGMFYTCFGDGEIHEFFLHDANSGRFTGRVLKLNPPVTEVQGACFSPNGHLYIASNAKAPDGDQYQTIWVYSPLNGHRFGHIKVLAEGGGDELEGICYAPVAWPDGRRAQIHAVLLENRETALDNIFFKSFSATRAELV